MPSVVFFSDTHLNHSVNLPEGDVLVFGGDACRRGTLDELRRFFEWFGGLPYDRKIMIAGNHDRPFEETPEEALELVPEGVEYLEDESTMVGSMKLYGSPWQPEFCNWAFNLPRGGEEIAEKWEQIPEDTDILVTHGPPERILDQARPISTDPLGGQSSEVRQVGSSTLMARIEQDLDLTYHLFGHIHESGGKRVKDGVVYMNGSIRGDKITYEGPPFKFDVSS